MESELGSIIGRRRKTIGGSRFFIHLDGMKRMEI